ncbi:MAG: dihydroxy-acid dehydratase [Microscillaceae bacterium]|jgi:dihydroxy-acid dehydratase|nr:dihydroxy-acid dehydratase [Microscillaceae bacterium]
MLNKYSRTITQDETQPASQAMFYALGLQEEDLNKAQVGIVSTGFDGNPCNMHLNDLAKVVKEGVNQTPDLLGLIFHTIGVSDGMSNGTEGMLYSLPSRDIIADSIENVAGGQFYDSIVAVVGCDKNMPGAMMALGRLNRPGLIVYGGTIAPGHYKGQDLNIISAFEALGEKFAGKISPEDFKGIIQHACPGAGACGGMYTANTMSSAIEAMGMSLPYSSSNPAIGQDKHQECLAVGKAMRLLLERDLKPKDIVTKKSFENAIRLIMVLGGSTNAVMHLIAMGKAFDIDIKLADFQRLSDSTPLLADLKPSGRYMMEDLHKVGGTPAVLKMMLAEGLLHGDCMTVSSKTMAENLAEVKPLAANQLIIKPLQEPLKKEGHIQILFGNLASQGAVAKITGKEGEFFEGPAHVFDDEYKLIADVQAGKVQKGEVIVIRYQGPKGAPGMPEMLKPTSAVMGAGLGKDVALITDGRFSGGSHGFVVGHITPEAQLGGLLALVKNGDKITIDAVNNRIDVHLSEEEIEKRRQEWTQPPMKFKKGILYKYYKTVSSASEGCVTDEF